MNDRDQYRQLGEASTHGPCTGGTAKVRDNLPECLSDENRKWCLARLDYGETEKYGAPLMVGWERGQEALSEELADAINYAVVCGLSNLASHLAGLLNGLSCGLVSCPNCANRPAPIDEYDYRHCHACAGTGSVRPDFVPYAEVE